MPHVSPGFGLRLQYVTKLAMKPTFLWWWILLRCHYVTFVVVVRGNRLRFNSSCTPSLSFQILTMCHDYVWLISVGLILPGQSATGAHRGA